MEGKPKRKRGEVYAMKAGHQKTSLSIKQPRVRLGLPPKYPIPQVPVPVQKKVKCKGNLAKRKSTNI